MDDHYEAFSHGLVVSKIWLCEELEKILDRRKISKPEVYILGGWHNVLSFMLLTRRPNGYQFINSYDLDAKSTEVANKICDTWLYEFPRVTNYTENVNDLNFDTSKNAVFINCSVDQFNGTQWYDLIPTNSIVILQTTNVTTRLPPWNITQPCPNIRTLFERYPMQYLLYHGSKKINYQQFGYVRYMMIGFK